MPRPVSNPANPYDSLRVEWVGPPPPARLELHEEFARSIVSENDSPDVPFRYSVNPYRGCQHACAYCYARPTHQYLSLGAGTDFDRVIVVKRNAPSLLRERLASASWNGDTLTFSGVTDPYQPIEASFRLTRACLEVCREFANPVAVITKASLVRRDADVLAALARGAGARAFLSIPFLDSRSSRLIEPGAPTPCDRFETLRILSDAGVPTGVAIAPLIPGLNESDMPGILERARDAGASHAFLVLLRLPAEVATVFRERLEEALPGRAKRVFSALRDMRAGRVRNSRFGERMRGVGPRWESVRNLFELQCRRLGLISGQGEALRPLLPVVRPARHDQGLLFEE